MSLNNLLERSISIYTLTTSVDTSGELKQSKTLSKTILAHVQPLSPNDVATLNSDLSIQHLKIYTSDSIGLNSIIVLDSKDYNVLRCEKFLNPKGDLIHYRTFIKAVNK